MSVYNPVLFGGMHTLLKRKYLTCHKFRVTSSCVLRVKVLVRVKVLLSNNGFDKEAVQRASCLSSATAWWTSPRSACASASRSVRKSMSASHSPKAQITARRRCRTHTACEFQKWKKDMSEFQKLKKVMSMTLPACAWRSRRRLVEC